MTGAESLAQTLLANGVDVCFANPGTSEMHFVAALDRFPGIRCVLGLQENVVTGAADGYWRMAERPAATLLHCGPGLANGLANLHNARRAQSGIVNIVGDQATHHRALDAPLTADTDGWARGVSAWTRTATGATTVGRDAAAAVEVARQGQIATLIVPADIAWNQEGSIGQALPCHARPSPHSMRSGTPSACCGAVSPLCSCSEVRRCEAPRWPMPIGSHFGRVRGLWRKHITRGSSVAAADRRSLVCLIAWTKP